MEASGGKDLPWWDISDDKMVARPIDPGRISYNDMTEEHARKCISELKMHSYQTFHSKMENANWQTIPST